MTSPLLQERLDREAADMAEWERDQAQMVQDGDHPCWIACTRCCGFGRIVTDCVGDAGLIVGQRGRECAACRGEGRLSRRRAR